MTGFSAEEIAEEILEPECLFTRPELLTHPNIPKPLHGLAPRTLVPQKIWDQLRRDAYAKNNYHCWACGKYVAYDTERKRFDNDEGTTLDAHEHYNLDFVNKTTELKEIVALCKMCHGYIHSGRMNALYDKGVYNEEDCWVVTTHGDSVLIDGGLAPYSDVDIDTYEDEWDEWRLLWNGKEYKSKWKNYEDWGKHYGVSA